MTLEEFVDQVFDSVTGYCQRALAPISERFAQLDAAIKAIPAGPQGPVGERGPAGESIKGERGERGEKGEPGRGERGEKGDPGKDGKSAYQIAAERGYQGNELQWLESLIGKPGKDGESIKGDPGASPDPEVIRAEISKAVAQAVAQIPRPKDGEDADPEQIASAVRVAVAALPPPKDGRDGKDADPDDIVRAVQAAVSTLPRAKDGKDADPAEIRKAVEAAVAAAIAAMPPPKDGEPGHAGRDGIDGKDGAPGPAGERGEKGDVGHAGRSAYQSAVERGFVGTEMQWLDSLQGKPGKDADPAGVPLDVVERVVAERVEAAIAKLPVPRDGEDGEDGRDATRIEVLPAIDESKSYPRGTYAEYRGGEIRAIRNTDPIKGDLAAAGWVVARRGIAEEHEEVLDEGRTIKRTTVYTDGTRLEREHKTSAILYREVYREGITYTRGDVVTWGGSAWYCLSVEDTAEKPQYGSKVWRLMVKEGRPGKDGERGPEGKAGRESTR